MKSANLYAALTTKQSQQYNNDNDNGNNNDDSNNINKNTDNVKKEYTVTSSTSITTAAIKTTLANTIKKRFDSAKVLNDNYKIIANTEQSQQRQQEQQQFDIIDDDDLYNIKPFDTMEYIIKFPKPQQQKYPSQTTQLMEQEQQQDDLNFVYNDTNIPIVMLLGWAGCQDRYLMKYSKIYEDRGLITVRYTAPVDTLFWKRSEMKPIGEKILKLVYDMNFNSHPLIFHIFSNGGAYLYQHISLAIRKHNTPLQIRGMIIDSAPGERRLLGLYRAVTAIYGRERKKFHRLTAIVITLTLGVMWFMEEVYTSFKSLFVQTEPIQTNPFNDLKNEPNEFPQLFLYSKGDVVIPYTDVEKFIKLRQQQGVDVSSICFEDAEHVKIYTKYPNQYIQGVCSFINNCLARPYRPELYDNLSMTPTTLTTSTSTSIINSFSSQNSLKYE